MAFINLEKKSLMGATLYEGNLLDSFFLLYSGAFVSCHVLVLSIIPI